jgi:hypothetical protein
MFSQCGPPGLEAGISRAEQQIRQVMQWIIQKKNHRKLETENRLKRT